LPIPSYVSVTNLDNNRSIVVRVNDRGPFHDARLIDLSYVGALKLGFADQGTARVLVEYLDPSQPTATENLSADSSQSASSEDPEQEAFQDRYLQVGAFNDLDSAQILQKKVQDHTSLPISVQKKDQLFKVWVGPIVGKLELQQLRKALLDAANISGFIISE